MKKFRNYMLASAGLAMFAITISLTTTGRAAAERLANEYVRIISTEAEPVFVKTVGTVPVRGDVHVSGGTVSVGSSPSAPVYTTQTVLAENLFDEVLDVPGSPSAQKKLLVIVPANKSLNLQSANGASGLGDATIYKNGIPVATLDVKLPFFPGNGFAYSNPPFTSTLTFAKPGDTVEASFNSDEGSHLKLHFTGVYYDVP
jgi:hypothetical protein